MVSYGFLNKPWAQVASPRGFRICLGALWWGQGCSPCLLKQYEVVWKNQGQLLAISTWRLCSTFASLVVFGGASSWHCPLFVLLLCSPTLLQSFPTWHGMYEPFGRLATKVPQDSMWMGKFGALFFCLCPQSCLPYPDKEAFLKRIVNCKIIEVIWFIAAIY